MDKHESYGFLVPQPIIDEARSETLRTLEKIEAMAIKLRVSDYEGLWLLRPDVPFLF